MSIITNEERQNLARGGQKVVTVLVPSRKRFHLLKKCLDHLYNNAHDPNQVEVVVRLDLDDHDSISKVKDLSYENMDLYFIIGNRFRGYIDLNKIYNECCALSRGEFLFLFNDDSYLMSKGWDEEIKKYSGQTVVLNPDTDDQAQAINTFPIMSRDIYDLLGHWSLQAHNDTWVSFVGQKIGIEKRISTVKIFHDRPGHPQYTGEKEKFDDVTWNERGEIWHISRPQFDEPKFAQLRIEDAINIKKYLESKRNNV